MAGCLAVAAVWAACTKRVVRKNNLEEPEGGEHRDVFRRLFL
jgi:hypothetical protein